MGVYTYECMTAFKIEYKIRSLRAARKNKNKKADHRTVGVNVQRSKVNDLSAADRFFSDLIPYIAPVIWNTNYYLLICRRWHARGTIIIYRSVGKLGEKKSLCPTGNWKSVYRYLCIIFNIIIMNMARENLVGVE